ncbi:solute carrier family 4 member 1a (Diego blood group) [Xiphophorus hellerii]|uniref:solute carrier family 4 member 1a (Diego blood group) n=1 Tax=Xiphophorus hellerii TaxID=8084 RepID=UPI0013B3D26C|nr:band 3 anion exchange protein-like [Xiphophorus hellerii]XP_032442588.1 band 3 anion exchange protein-like [Xiphophorus hellerii]
MENNFTFEEGSDMSYEDNDPAFPSPLKLTSEGLNDNFDVERNDEEKEKETEPPPEAIVIPSDSDAFLNVNTNATTRGDAQAYVELNELQGNIWQETSRWVGYEENLDPNTRQWGPSHVSYLTFKSLLQVRRAMNSGAIIFDMNASTLASVAEKIADELVSKSEIRPSDRDSLLRALLLRRSQNEGPMVTPAGDIQMQTFSVVKKRDSSDNMEASVVLTGVLDLLQKPVVAFVRLSDTVVMESILESSVPIRFVFMMVGPSSSELNYTQIGRAMGALLADWVFSLEAHLAQTEKELNTAIADFMDCSIVIPPTEIQDKAMLESIVDFQKKMLRERLRPTDTRLMFGEAADAAPEGPKEDPLARTGYPFGGMVKDIKRRYRHYLSDYIDALNPQVLAAIIFIYFAALSPAITFGGLLADKTDKMMGVSELMISTSVQGMIFCIIAAQPVLIIGFSGPLLLFEEAFFVFCTAQGIEYIVGRIWVGMWLVVIVVVVVAVEGSFLVRFISRFTQEIFSILISLIFIYETFSKLIKIFRTHPLILNYEHLNDTLDNPFHPVVKEHVEIHSDGNVTIKELEVERPYPNTALLSMCLMFGCFFIAYFLRQFKNGTFFPGPIRRLIGDFGVPIAIFFMIAVDISIEDAYTQKLVVPKGIEVTNPKSRGWIINPMGEKKPFPIWMMGACCVPAVLVFILIFMESQITTLIVSKPERKMVKGSGFHFDLLLLVTMGGIFSIFGVPWLSAATVRSVTHANALTVMSKGPKPVIEKVIEQRISGLIVALMVGVSIFMEPILRMIPMTALFGIFLYMGITSLNGVQMWDRILLLITPKKYHPSDAYATRVKTMRMHIFTLIQIVCLGVLWIVKQSPFSLALPFFLILTIPLRMFMTGRIFTPLEMKCLDADDAKVKFDDEDMEDGLA